MKPTGRQRTLAGVIDAVLLGGAIAAYTRHCRRRGEQPNRTLSSAVAAAYLVVPVAAFGGTPGQLVVGVRVVDAKSHRPIGWRQASLRWALWSGPAAGVTAVTWRLQGRARTVAGLAATAATAVYRRRLGQDGVDRLTRTRVVSIRA